MGGVYLICRKKSKLPNMQKEVRNALTTPISNILLPTQTLSIQGSIKKFKLKTAKLVERTKIYVGNKIRSSKLKLVSKLEIVLK